MSKSISPGQLEALKKYTAPDIDQGIQRLGARPRKTEGYLGYDIRCLSEGLGPMVGYAVTVVSDNLTTDRTPSKEVQRRYLEAIDASPKPAVLVFRCAAHDRVRGLVFGGMMAAVARALGAVGLVTDGGVRDLDQAQELGFHFFAPGTVPSHGAGAFANIVEVGVPVTIGGQTIRPGELVFGDKNGIVLIPLEIADQLAEACEKQLQTEAEMLSFVKSKDFSLQAYLKRRSLA